MEFHFIRWMRIKKYYNSISRQSGIVHKDKAMRQLDLDLWEMNWLVAALAHSFLFFSFQLALPNGRAEEKKEEKTSWRALFVLRRKQLWMKRAIGWWTMKKREEQPIHFSKLFFLTARSGPTKEELLNGLAAEHCSLGRRLLILIEFMDWFIPALLPPFLNSIQVQLNQLRYLCLAAHPFNPIILSINSPFDSWIDEEWEIVGPLYSNRPTSTNQKLFNNFIVLIY